ncbi:MAG: hypothetical protein IJU23_02795 [Proteobacteria bacterium]|nr:hypothetical protein [Pseudomonadota bacterium]
MKFQYLLFLVIVSILASACSDSEPWPNSRRYHKTETGIFYQAPEYAAEAIPAAYHPTAMINLSDDVILYADSGTRHIVELDLKAGTQRALFDFSAFPPVYSDAWGSEIIRADDSWYILAMPGQSLLWFNVDTGQTAVVGDALPENAVIPEADVALQSVSFQLFGGLHRTNSGFYIVLANRIFYLPWNGISPESLLSSRLEPIAGTYDDGIPNSRNPLEIKLKLFDYTYFAEKDGWLFFWDYRKLRAVRDGVTIVVTGDGFITPDSAFDEFYAGELDGSTPIVVWNDKLYSPYWNATAVIEIDIEAMNEDTATGMVRNHFFSGETHSLAVSSRGMMSIDANAGSFWLHTSVNQSELLFGAKNKSERYDFITDPDSPYDPEAIIAPQAMTTMHNGELGIVYSPTLRLLSALDMETGMDSPIWEVSTSHFVSDRKNKTWLADGIRLRFLDIDDKGMISNSYVPRFFNRANKQGIPCSKEILKLQEIPQLQVPDMGLLMYERANNRILTWTEDEVNYLHNGGWLYPSSMTKDEYAQSLAVRLIEQWKASRWIEIALVREGERQYLTASNLASTNVTFLGTTIPTEKMRRMAGGGDKSIEEGVSLEETKMDDIEAIALDSSLQSVYFARPGGIWRANPNGVWQKVDGCKADASWHIRNLEVGGTSRYPFFLAATDDGIYGCSARKMHFAGTDISDSWQKLDIEQVSACSTSLGAFIRDGRVCVDVFQTGEPTCATPDGDMTDAFVACNDSNIYVSGTSNGRVTVWTAPVDDIKSLSVWGGNGDGLPRKTEIQNANIGTELVGMDTDGIPYLYFMMRDTASIWRISALREIEADSKVERMLTDERLGDAQAFAVAHDSTMAVIIDNVLYRADRNGLEELATVEGDVLEMISFGYAFVVMTTEGIFTWENGWYRQKAKSWVEIDGKSIKYAVPGTAHPRMVQSPGENAVLVPVFEGSRIVRIAL